MQTKGIFSSSPLPGLRKLGLVIVLVDDFPPLLDWKAISGVLPATLPS